MLGRPLFGEYHASVVGDFGNVSGLDLNPSKSFIYFGGVKETMKADILNLTGFVEGSFPFTYLAVPLSPHRLLASQYTPLLN